MFSQDDPCAPCKIAGVAMPDLFAGRTPMLMAPPITLILHVRGGRLRRASVSKPIRACIRRIRIWAAMEA
jgi:hypothetical protein